MVSDPPHLGMFLPPVLFLLVSPLEIPRIPSADLLRNSFRRVSKNGFRRAILARFCFSVRLAPPPLALPSLTGRGQSFWELSRFSRKILQTPFSLPPSLEGLELSGHYSREWSECIRVNGVNE